MRCMLIVGALFAALMSAAPAEQGPLAGLDDYIGQFGKFGRAAERPAP